jgi:rhodanese-related sulfurtransferase
MNRFNNKYGAIALVGLAALYMIISLATGRSAASEPPPNLAPAEAAVDVWQGTALLAQRGDAAVVVDVRPREQFELYHVARSVSKPGASAGAVLDAVRGKAAVLIVADTDANASKLAGEIAAQDKAVAVHFLKEGVRAWYLTYVVPVPLFNEKPPPYGWTEAMAAARAFVNDGAGSPEDVVKAVGKLSTSGYAPTQLEGKKKPAAGGAKKKIAGGCG